MRIALLFFITMVLAACGQANTPIGSAPSDNGNVPAALLLTVDGCRVYRFHDAGEYRYIANCAGATTVSDSYTRTCGKNCYKTVDASTMTIYEPDIQYK